MSVSNNNNLYTYIRSPVPKYVDTELDSTLHPPASTHIILKNESTLDSFNSLLKFIATTGVLDFLFTKVFSETSSICRFDIDEVDQFELKTKIVKTLTKCKNWIDCHIDCIDGVKVIPAKLFKQMIKWTTYLDKNSSRTKLELYNMLPSKVVAKELQKSLMQDLYVIEDVSYLVSEKLSLLKRKYAESVKENIKINSYLKTLHTFLFNSINAIRTAPINSSLNGSLHEKLIDKMTKWIMPVDVIEMNFIQFFKKFYQVFSDCRFTRDFIVISPPFNLEDDYLWNISDQIKPDLAKDSLYILIDRSTKHGIYLNPLKFSEDGSINIDIDNHSYEYVVKNAIVYIGDDTIGFNLFIESTLDENGFEKFLRHEDDEINAIPKRFFVELAASAVLIQLTLKKPSL